MTNVIPMPLVGDFLLEDCDYDYNKVEDHYMLMFNQYPIRELGFCTIEKGDIITLQTSPNSLGYYFVDEIIIVDSFTFLLTCDGFPCTRLFSFEGICIDECTNPIYPIIIALNEFDIHKVVPIYKNKPEMKYSKG